MGYVRKYLDEAAAIVAGVEGGAVEDLVAMIHDVRQCSGRLYVCGLGGSAATASHAVNDLRKLCDLDAICPTDNPALMTAFANDRSWPMWLREYLAHEGMTELDGLLVLSVGGGDEAKHVSEPLIFAAGYAVGSGAPVGAIVGREGGAIGCLARAIIVRVPNLFPERVTPHVEGITSVILHAIVSHPKLQKNPTKW
jgi:D-sedoheptulose 7-phosphate isomerase